MDFVKKNIGLLIFLVVCLGVVIYLVVAIMGGQRLREENKAKRQKHLEEIASVKGKKLRFDEENLAKATKNAEKAKTTQGKLIRNLGEKRLLPGINFDVDPDEESSKDSSDSDDAGSAPKVDRYKDQPYRKLFDEWMKGSLFDARETLTNELIKMNIIYFKLNDEDDEEDDENVMNGNVGGGADGQDAAEGQAAQKDDAADGAKAADKEKKADDKPLDARAVAEAKKKAEEKEKAAAEKKVIEEKKAEMDAGKSTYQMEKEKRMKIIKDQTVPEYFMFTEYVTNRESGLRNKKEKRDCFRQLILLDVIVRILRKAEIKTLNSIDFPCGLETIDGDKYTSTPVAITVTGKPECIEAFLNLLNANENYIFYLKDIVSFDATVQLNTDATLAFNNGTDSGSAALNNFLKSVGTTVGTVGGMDMGGGGRMADMGGGDEGRGRRGGRRGRRGGGDEMGPMERGGGMARGGMMAMGGRGGMEDGMQQKAEPLVRTRKAYRIFADSVEESGRNEDGRNGFLGQSKSLEEGTSVTLSLNFEFVEFKVAE